MSFTGQVDVISLHATWQSKIVEEIDDSDGSQIDLTSASAVEVTIRDFDDCKLVIGTITNGKVALTVPAPAGIFWQFEVDDLKCLCPGSYRLVVLVTTINNVVTCLVDGTIAVTD